MHALSTFKPVLIVTFALVDCAPYFLQEEEPSVSSIYINIPLSKTPTNNVLLVIIPVKESEEVTVTGRRK